VTGPDSPLDALRSIRVFTSERSKWTTVVSLALVAALFVGAGVLVRGRLAFLGDPVALRAYVRGFGPFAPVAFVVLQASQVVLAPVPGQVLAFASGYLFGPVYGTVYSLLGAALGSYVAIALSRRFGRPYVERVVHVETLDRFDALVQRRGLVALFLVFLVPGLPDDVVCFAAGLTELDVRKLVAVSVLGRLPGYFVINLAGARVAAERFADAGLIVAVFLALSAFGYLQRDALLARLGPK
jgi:uncharacterized membrane protein YdjX (TVP38/TMEM64 family)